MDSYRERITAVRELLLDALGATPTPEPLIPVWVHVSSRTPVSASALVATSDGSLPTACGWPPICDRLGPCSRHLAGSPCRLDASVPTPTGGIGTTAEELT